jgi:glyoxylase-like metal-dependent hydrolase (beta-lactamase superfamily II)
MHKPDVAGFHDPRTGSIQYVVACPVTGKCAIIDPVLDFDEKSGSTATTNADRLLAHVEKHGLSIEWILDTHPHADHFSAAPYIKARTGRRRQSANMFVRFRRSGATFIICRT